MLSSCKVTLQDLRQSVSSSFSLAVAGSYLLITEGRKPWYKCLTQINIPVSLYFFFIYIYIYKRMRYKKLLAKFVVICSLGFFTGSLGFFFIFYIFLSNFLFYFFSILSFNIKLLFNFIINIWLMIN
jgi:hypothetical protein